MKKFVLTLFAAAALFAIPAHAASPELDKVLRQLDVASAGFHSAQAEFKWDQYTKVVDSTDTQTGTVSFKRTGVTTMMTAQVRTLNGADDSKTVVFDGKTLQLYQPRIKQITQFSAAKNKNQYESFLTLGFGGSGKDLEANWTITYAGTETLKDGSTPVQTVHLDLVSKQESVRNMFSKISIWVDPTRGVSLKQVFTEPTGDARTAYYYGIKTNIGIDPKTFVLDTKGIQVIQR
jgi:outer membrane lipoprotein-sorting protein